jgi:hypothetical protein
MLTHQEGRRQQHAVKRNARAIVVGLPVLQPRVAELQVVERVLEELLWTRSEIAEPAVDVVLLRQRRLIKLLLRTLPSEPHQ